MGCEHRWETFGPVLAMMNSRSYYQFLFCLTCGALGLVHTDEVANKATTSIYLPDQPEKAESAVNRWEERGADGMIWEHRANEGG